MKTFGMTRVKMAKDRSLFNLSRQRAKFAMQSDESVASS